jgi:hypothetical protein
MSAYRPIRLAACALAGLSVLSACEKPHTTAPVERTTVRAVPAPLESVRGRAPLVLDRGTGSGPAAGQLSASAPGMAQGTAVSFSAAGSASPALAWQNTDGQRSIWQMNGTSWDGDFTALPTVSPDWQIVAAADFSGNGSADLVWFNAAHGMTSIWLMDGHEWNGGFATLPVVPVGWEVAAAGDFNADGKPDLVWQNVATGQRSVWLMNGTSWDGAFAELPHVPTAWRIAAAADFSGDGHTDLVWQNIETGQRSIWHMSGTTWTGTFTELPTIPVRWRIAGAADFKWNGTPDLVWQNIDTGERSIWLMDGMNWSGSFALLPQVPPSWDIGAVLSFSGPSHMEMAEAHAASSYHRWWAGEWSANTSGPFMSAASFQHSTPAANFGMIEYSAFPRPALGNATDNPFYTHIRFAWTAYYSAIVTADSASARLALSGATGAEADRVRAFSAFVRGLSYLALSAAYDQAEIVGAGSGLHGYNEVLAHGLALLDEAIAISEASSFVIPESWMSRSVSSAELVRLAYSYKARYRAAVARTVPERAAVNWGAVIADAERGILQDWAMRLNHVAPWGVFGTGYYVAAQGTYNASTGQLQGFWQQISYFILGMADQSGRYQRWIETPLAERHADFGGDPADPFVIVTPDNRFPQGTTRSEQLAKPGRYYQYAPTSGQHGQPQRGTWRWSWYLNIRNLDWLINWAANPDYIWVPKAEMDLLRAEGHMHMGNRATAAALINITRTAAGLSPTDADGSNFQCVPRLANNTCGGLFEMLKWEKRNEQLAQGLMGSPWFFDSRGWGDLAEGTFLQLPVPAAELEARGLPVYTFGGGGPGSALPGTYGH